MVDKLDKLPAAVLEEQLRALGVGAEAATLLLSRIQVNMRSPRANIQK